MNCCGLHHFTCLQSRHLPLRRCLAPRQEGVRGVARAERRSSTRPRRNQSSDGNEEFRGNSLWDSNAEGVRRNWTQSRDGTGGGRGSSSSQSAPVWNLPQKEWDYDAEDKRPDGKREWWKLAGDDDDDEYDYESDEEDEEEEGSPWSFDLKSILQEQVLSSLRWGLPVTLLVLPWLLGNPIVLMIGLAAIPPVQKAVGPVVSEIWQAFLDFSGYPPPKRRRKPRTDYNEQDRPLEADETFSGWGDGGGGGLNNSRPYRYSKARYDSNENTASQEGISYQDKDLDVEGPLQELRKPIVDVASRQGREFDRGVNMGGWDDLEADRRRIMPVRRAKKTSKMRRNNRKEQPLLLRLIVALFPFLRNWGGWLSVLLLFPSLTVLDNIRFAISIS